MLRILCNIISKKIDDGSYAYQPGNVLYFSKNRKACAAIMFTKTAPVIKASSRDPSENDGDKYKRLYTKLFDDGSVDYYRKTPNPYQHCYNDKDIKELRREADDGFPHFLKTKMKDNSDLLPFGDKFLTMLVPIAYRIGSRSRQPANYARALKS